MNILPHKSWHVRTKANIARVRKDEAKAAEEEKERQRRVELAESEARTSHLRQKAKQKFGTVKRSPEPQSSAKKEDDEPVDKEKPAVLEHVNLFRDVEEGTAGFKKTNEEREREEKETREKYEKSIGYLTYLGQDTKVTSWYQTKRLRDETQETPLVEDNEDKQHKAKQRHDPLNVIQKFVGPQKPSQAKTRHAAASSELHSESKSRNQSEIRNESKTKTESSNRKRKRSDESPGTERRKHKRSKRKETSPDSSDSSSSKYRRRKRKHKKHKRKKSRRERSPTPSSPDESLEEEKRKKLESLRLERLKREREEKARAERVLAKLRGETVAEPDEKDEESRRRTTGKKQKYNSQYNPELAKQNKLDRIL